MMTLKEQIRSELGIYNLENKELNQSGEFAASLIDKIKSKQD